MAPAGTNPKIEELRFKLKGDPKSRLFYPLAEELRKAGQPAEAEQVLRGGLTAHPTYLSAWVVLGRVLREQGKHAEAVDPLNRALELDRGNAVAARLLAETYLALGDRVEAIKKYKLVHALLPGDDDTEAMIHRLETELNAAPVAVSPEEPWADDAAPAAGVPVAPGTTAEDVPAEAPPAEERDPFEITYNRLRREAQREAELEIATGDAEPMAAAHAQSPFEEQAAELGYSADAFAVEEPPGVHLSAAPIGAELPTEFPPPALPAENEPPISSEPAEEAELFEPASEIAPGFIQGSFEANVPPPPPSAEDFTRTITMADLYASQGLIDDARSIYEDVLARDPANETVLARLQALDSAGPAEPETSAEEEAAQPEPVSVRPEAQKIRRLENWLTKVKRSGVEGV